MNQVRNELEYNPVGVPGIVKAATPSRQSSLARKRKRGLVRVVVGDAVKGGYNSIWWIVKAAITVTPFVIGFPTIIIPIIYLTESGWENVWFWADRLQYRFENYLKNVWRRSQEEIE